MKCGDAFTQEAIEFPALVQSKILPKVVRTHGPARNHGAEGAGVRARVHGMGLQQLADLLFLFIKGAGSGSPMRRRDE